MIVRSWSTDATKGRERFAYWREAVCQAVLNVDTVEPPEEGFFGDIAAVSVGEGRFVRFSSAPHRIIRTRRMADRALDEHYLLSVQLSGASRIEQGDEAVAMAPGEIALLDGTRPFEVGFPRQVGRMIAVVPRRAVESRAPWLATRGLRKLQGNAWCADLLRQHLGRLADPEAKLIGAELLFDNFCNLTALATLPEARLAAAPSALQTEAMLSYLRRNASDPDLDAAAVAAQFGVSVRTVHNRFAAIGTSLGKWLLDHRLETTRRALEGQVWSGYSIAQIAYAAGFSDLSHFTKAFKARFGMTPRECRAAAVPRS